MVEKDASLQGKSLEEIIRSSSGAVFNNVFFEDHNCPD